MLKRSEKRYASYNKNSNNDSRRSSPSLYVVVVAEPNCGPLKVCIRVYRRYRITDKKRHRSG